MRASSRDRPPSVLVVSLGGLGDFVTRWPLWQSVRRSFPNARITFLGYPRHGLLGMESGLFDRLLDIESARSAAPAALCRGCDRVIIVRARGDSPLWDEFRKTAGGRAIEISAFPDKGSRTSVGEHIIRQATAAGLEPPGAPVVTHARGTGERADALWKNLPGDGRVIAVHPGSGAASKNWPPEKFARLSREINARGDGVLVFTGEAERERGIGKERDAWGRRAAFVENPDIPLLAALLARCGAYAGNDSGVSHLAALAGTQATVIFGPTDPAVWAPRGANVTVLQREMECSPCSSGQRRRCARRKCLDMISVEEVMETIFFRSADPSGSKKYVKNIRETRGCINRRGKRAD